MTTDNRFGTALRDLRTRRRLSQLDLAVRTDTTQRHVSFMESGRSAPGRPMVLRLAESLELPLRERNDLLHSAGFAAAYPETDLDDPALRPVLAALHRILDGHRPYPAFVIDRHGDLVAANPAFAILTEGVAPPLLEPPLNVYRMALHPHGMAPRIANPDEWSRHILERLGQESRRNPHPRLTALHTELESYRPAPGPAPLGFAVPLVLDSAGGRLRLMTTVTTFATAADVTVAELKLEAFLPADEATRTILESFGAQRSASAGPACQDGPCHCPASSL